MDDGERSCRVCRSGEEPGSPLYKPCKCSGSISWIHQDCLESWLSVSRSHRCELCKHPFKWEKVYASQAPPRLPTTIILRHLVLTGLKIFGYFFRAILVAFIWLAFLPYSILWVWRGLFHLAKGWGASWTAAIQEVEWSGIGLASLLLPQGHLSSGALQKNASTIAAAAKAARASSVATSTKFGALAADMENRTIVTFNKMINGNIVSSSMRPKLETLEDALHDLLKVWVKPGDKAVLNAAARKAAEQSLSSKRLSWLPHSPLVDRVYFTTSNFINKQWEAHKGLLYTMAKDAFSGQIIVCCVIMAFIAAFLLREWVMANQPHPHAINGVPDAPVNNGAILARPNPGEQVFAQALRDAERAQHQLDAHLAGEDRRRAALEQMDTLIDEALRQEGLGRAHTPQQPERLGIQDAPTPSDASMHHTGRAGSPALQRVMSPSFERALSPSGPASEHGDFARPLSPFTDHAAEETLDRSSRAGYPAGHGLLFGSTDDSQEYSVDPDKHYGIGSRARDSLASSIYSSSDDGDSVGNDMISRKHRIADPDDYGVESASDGEMEPETPATAVVGPAPAAPAGAVGNLHRARGHDHGNDSDDDDDDDDPLFGPDPRANVAFGADDPLAIDDDENPDDLFFEADLQGILEAVGIHGPIFVLLQNVALVALLIASLLVVAVWVPLMFGKTVAATNAQKLLLLPINLVRLFTDPVADYAIKIFGRNQQMEQIPSPSFLNKVFAFFTYIFSHFKRGQAEPTTKAIWLAKGATAVEMTREMVLSAISGCIGFVTRHWHSMAIGDSRMDRLLCIALGYAIIMTGAVVYLKYTQNAPARQAGVAIRETVKQHLTLVKAAIFFFVEIVIFPAICGALLNLATLPLIPGATFSTRIAYYIRSPISSIFLTWLTGTNFMFSFAQAISIVRKCIRKGVLYFIRDPSDPEANPLREILETPVYGQAKKITRSLLVYGGIVLTCFGFFPWLSRLIPLGIFPLRWDMTRPLSTIPFDLIFVLAIMPLTTGRMKSKRTVRRLVKQWCTFSAHQLRLTSFMLGTRRADEEGTHVRRTWGALLTLKRASVPSGLSDHAHNELDSLMEKYEQASNNDVYFQQDGAFARVVAIDNIKIVPGKMFVRVKADGTPVDEEGVQAIKAQQDKEKQGAAVNGTGSDKDLTDDKFTIVYIPPHFKARIMTFIYLIWLMGSVAIFVSMCAPLIVGRVILDSIFKEPLHDTYSFIVGVHALIFTWKAYLFLSRRIHLFSRYKRHLSTYAFGAHPAREVIPRLLKQGGHLALLALNGGIVMPLLFGLAVRLYVFMPLEILLGGDISSPTDGSAIGGNEMPTIRLAMEWCYGVVYVSLAWSIAPMLRENGLVILIREVQTEGILKNVNKLNKSILSINRSLVLLLSCPLLVTYSHRRLVLFLWRHFFHSSNAKHVAAGAAAIPDSLQYDKSQAYVFKTALFTVSLTTLAMMLAKPAKKIARKWAETVWESEFVIKRKLKNIDDDTDDKEKEVGNGTNNMESGVPVEQ